MNHITTEPLNPNACMKKTETNEDQKSLLQSFYSISVFEPPPPFLTREAMEDERLMLWRGFILTVGHICIGDHC